MATTEDRRDVDATEEWRRELYEAKPERDALFTTMSGLPVEPLYSPDSVEVDYERDLGYPGVYPYTRGVYPSMYRGRLWTMRQFAGFGTAQETNARFRLHKTAENLMLEAFARAGQSLETELAPQLQRRESDPYTLARKLLVSSLKKEYGDELASHRAA